MKKIIRSLFWRSDDDRFSFDDGRKSYFRLLYGNLLVGELSFFDGKWHFSYSAEFIRQNTILPLVNFPTKDKVYVSVELWPFFASRIPSDAQLQNSTESRDLVDSLRKYGRHTITNSFVLNPA